MAQHRWTDAVCGLCMGARRVCALGVCVPHVPVLGHTECTCLREREKTRECTCVRVSPVESHSFASRSHRARFIQRCSFGRRSFLWRRSRGGARGRERPDGGPCERWREDGPRVPASVYARCACACLFDVCMCALAVSEGRRAPPATIACRPPGMGHGRPAWSAVQAPSGAVLLELMGTHGTRHLANIVSICSERAYMPRG